MTTQTRLHKLAEAKAASLRIVEPTKYAMIISGFIQPGTECWQCGKAGSLAMPNMGSQDFTPKLRLVGYRIPRLRNRLMKPYHRKQAAVAMDPALAYVTPEADNPEGPEPAGCSSSRIPSDSFRLRDSCLREPSGMQQPVTFSLIRNTERLSSSRYHSRP
ncbi:hypothetical protein G7K_6012-t1 [Saitoella complicata NRRL Y-17804]|uniref:Uncharacterized protein n=1 Tax=Saitoella complicata (strain BCRC 22490 / CBS 7301 / JCM 7358 / NBRC 10748 / NRRL Y-17804) TaxID=698492 RepID=A0A0E9NQ14_SAICN|nr:hypothetical protein G7K_6012-t1 [Saitoella complicata NRRL Y-17804]